MNIEGVRQVADQLSSAAAKISVLTSALQRARGFVAHHSDPYHPSRADDVLSEIDKALAQ